MRRRAFAVVQTVFLTSGVLLAGGATAHVEPASEPAVARAASTFTSLSPARVLDTRTGTGGISGPVSGTVTLDLARLVPVAATAVVLNVTGVAPTASTFVTVFPSGTGRPGTSNLNLSAGDTRANQVTVALGAGRKVSLYNNAGATHLVADLAGYYSTLSGAKFTALPPGRLLDTRWDSTPVGPGATRVLDLSDRVPVSATAVTVNLTATNVTAPTFVTAWPTGTSLPNASNLNVPAGDTRPNLVTVAVGANRQINVYNNAGRVDLAVDLAGFYTPDYGAAFVPLNPARVLDTRNGSDPLGAGLTTGRDLADGLPLTATGVALNVTGVDATASTHLLAWGGLDDGRHRPSTSTLNLSSGQTASNAAMIAFDGNRTFLLYNANGSVHVIADLVGVFVVLDRPCVADCLYAWGDNNRRKLGTAQAVRSSATPSPVVLSGVRAVAGGHLTNGYALRTDGTVWAWGNNLFGQLGNGWKGMLIGGNAAGNTNAGGSVVPVPVLGMTGVTAVAGSSSHAYALRDDGTVWAWGANVHGKLGNGEFVESSVPVQVRGLTDVIAIASNPDTGYAVRADGTVWAWGAGLLGNPPPLWSSPVPVQVAGLTGVIAVAGNGSGAYVLRADGTVWGWGNGQLGNGQPCDPSVSCGSVVPVRVAGLTRVTAIMGSSSPYYTTNGYAVRDNGTVWAWGSNVDGALGNGVTCDPTAAVCESSVPVRVSGLRDVTQVATFGGGGYALRADGTVWAWGSNVNEALGNDSVAGHTTVPVPVVGLTGVSAIDNGFGSGYAVVPNP